jgi:acetyl-CoA acyltransferase
MESALIVSAVRTPVGKAKKGTLAQVRPDTLLGLVLREVVRRKEVDPSLVEDIQVGCAFPEGEQGMNLARIGVFLAGFPPSVPASTVNRFCSSGLQAIAIIANRIQVGEISCGIGGGVESMSMVPMGGFHFSPNPELVEQYPEVYISMGQTAEIVAERYKISRQEQDRWSVISHGRAISAIKKGLFEEEIVPVPVVKHTENGVQKVLFTTDEGPREGTTPEVLAKLKPAFKVNGTVTAGNASQMSDGSSALLLMSEKKAMELNLKPLARFVTFAVAGCLPEEMGIGPVFAIPKALKQAGLSLRDIGLFEINEAFASQFLYVIRTLDIPEEIVNVNGGAIALGHPLGCTGAKLTTQLIYEMIRRKVRYGIVSMCIGGGMGACGIFENLTI